jgi:hypothetical protein
LLRKFKRMPDKGGVIANVNAIPCTSLDLVKEKRPVGQRTS